MNRRLIALLAASVAAISVPILGYAESAATASTPRIPRIVNGSRVSSTNSPVVRVNLNQNGEQYICSGALITPKVVLTAWHCVGRRARSLTVFIGRKRFTVARVKVHPKVSVDARGLIKNDVALLYLAKSATTPRLSLLTSRPPQANDTVSVIGYGLDEYGDFGVLRQGVARIDQVDGQFFQTLFDSFLQANSCSGDSGGPAILSYRDASGQLRKGIIGTVSTGTTNDCLFGDRTFYVNIQSPEVLQFIRANASGVRQQ